MKVQFMRPPRNKGESDRDWAIRCEREYVKFVRSQPNAGWTTLLIIVKIAAIACVLFIAGAYA